MDVFAHFLWAYAILRKQKHALLAGLFGVLPDLFAFVPFMASRMFQGSFEFGKPNIADIPAWVFQVYNMSHSLVIFTAVFGIVWLLTGSPQWFLMGWAIHILADIPTHVSSFFPTPFLYPLSSYTFSGIEWSEPQFMIINYGALALVYLLIFARKM